MRRLNESSFWQKGEYAHAQQLFEAMNRMRAVWGQLQPVGMRRSEIGVLGAVDHLEKSGAKAVSISSLAREMGQSVPGVSQKVSELEKQGYLRRLADKKDRRVVTVALTPKGRKVAEACLRDFLLRIEEALARMGEEKSGALFALMQQLTEALETIAPEKKGGNPV